MEDGGGEGGTLTLIVLHEVFALSNVCNHINITYSYVLQMQVYVYKKEIPVEPSYNIS